MSNLSTFPSKSHLKFTPNFKSSSLSYFTTVPVPVPVPVSKSKSGTHFQNMTIRFLFTGIVEEMGEIKQPGASTDGGFDMKIRAKFVLPNVHLGDSIAVNGTCLTETEFDHQAEDFTVGLSLETLRKTSLSELKPGALVNLERAVQPTSRMGWHFVQGHVDGTGEIVSMKPEEDSLWIKVKADRSLLKYVVPKAFIAVDGTSLTVVDVFDDEDSFNFVLVE